MSDILLVFPDGWIQLDWSYITSSITDMNETNVNNWIQTSQFSYIEEFLKELSLIDQSAILIDAKLIDQNFAILLG